MIGDRIPGIDVPHKTAGHKAIHPEVHLRLAVGFIEVADGQVVAAIGIHEGVGGALLSRPTGLQILAAGGLAAVLDDKATDNSHRLCFNPEGIADDRHRYGRGRRARALVVGHRIGDGCHCAVVIRLRREGDRAVGVIHRPDAFARHCLHLAAGVIRRRDLDARRIERPIRIRVIDKHINRHRAVLGHRPAVRRRNGGIVLAEDNVLDTRQRVGTVIAIRGVVVGDREAAAAIVDNRVASFDARVEHRVSTHPAIDGVIAAIAEEAVVVITTGEGICPVIAFNAVGKGIAGNIDVAVTLEGDVEDAGIEGEVVGCASGRIECEAFLADGNGTGRAVIVRQRNIGEDERCVDRGLKIGEIGCAVVVVVVGMIWVIAPGEAACSGKGRFVDGHTVDNGLRHEHDRRFGLPGEIGNILSDNQSA